MSARPRDLLKTRAQRIGEVFSILHLKGGQANSQLVAFGGNVTPHTTNTQFAVSDTVAVLGQAIIDKASQVAIAAPAGANTGAGQFRKVLVEMDAAGTISFNIGAIAGAANQTVRPAESVDKVVLAVVDIPASFTAGTTALTGLITKEAYWAP